MVRHLYLLEDLDGDDVEARPSIDESAVDGDVVDCRHAQEGNCAHSLSGDWMVLSSKLILLVDHFNLWLLTLGCATAIAA
jgi:hypothetical protein